MLMVLADGKPFRAGPWRRNRSAVAMVFLDEASRFALGIVVSATTLSGHRQPRYKCPVFRTGSHSLFEIVRVEPKFATATGTPGVVPPQSATRATDGHDNFRSVLDAFVADPPARSIETIQQLLTELQYSTAAIRLLARARCGEPSRSISFAR